MSTREQQLIDRFESCRVLVVGDMMLDEYVFGEVTRISPEAPVPILHVQRVRETPGGSANVALNARCLGARVELIGVVGADSEGERLLTLLREAGIETLGVQRSAARPTTRKTRIIARQQQVVRVDRELDLALDAAEITCALEAFARRLPDSDVVVISDYAKGMVAPALLGQLIDSARERGTPVVVDPKGLDFGKYRRATVLTPNVRELGLAVDRELKDPRSLESAAKELIAELELDALLVTQAEAGMTLFSAQGAAVRLPTQALEVFDVTGAGDTVASVLALALGTRCDFAVAARVANVAAGISVSKLGTASVTPDELRHALAQRSPFA
jgi:D-beta-D-heptose 7-phosphate kinase/D-beta-D-heptose 1-phosphate adenosyltransferase